MAVDKDVLIENKRPTFDYFNATNFVKMQENTKTEERELDRFNNSYSTKKLNDVYEKYNMFEEDVTAYLEEEVEEREEVKPVSPSVNRDADFKKLIREQNKFEELEDTLTYQKVERNPKVSLQLNNKTKVTIFTYTMVSLLLVFLFVYNAFSISNINTNIQNLNSSITTEQANIERVIKDIGNMTDEDNVLDMATDLSFSEVPVQNIVQVTLYEKQTPVSYEGQTNWFDAVCKFLSNLFGG